MPSITVSNLSWSTPDGHTLFENLDLAFAPQRTGLIGRNGVGKSTLLSLIAGTLAPQSGAIARDGTLGILRQSVRPEAGETIASLFGTTEALALLERAEAGTANTDELATADWTLEARMAVALDKLGLSATPQTPLSTLSGGQRTRAMLAALIFAEPDFILLDEPTNNLDRDGRDAVIALLAAWRGGAVVISHDRELLETMDQIVEMTTLGVTVYGGNWTHYHERKAIELASARHDLATAERRIAEVDRKVQETRERKAHKDSTGRRRRAKGDTPKILLNAMRNKAENTSGENARLATRQREDAAKQAAEAREKIEVLDPLAVALPPADLPRGKTVLQLAAVSAGYDPDTPVIRDFSLEVTGPERIAVTGPNGSGKTTLLKLITGDLAPFSGTIRVPARLALLDQQVALLERTQTIRDNFRRLNPQSTENACRAALARFRFRADAALRTVDSLSGGQMLRAGLACTLGGPTPPQLLILDEPTNHLDLDAIEAIEAGLKAYDGALLVVSHDRPFLKAIGIEREITLGG
ncbi:ABC-F family ATP-binding cassette domain-containing protein [Pelagibacterium xiamenense]|uniref:ABC-F family ATP-binding cassette domain-containing protein n=1 Tax=Pelagibacterium xiamenense TaxID=2901140 RepID=UPI001E434FF1|nr:ABC-F family ATP-binding cassette domain-containing protein [Pelagibacterium xiamenense]MCD7060019.1 ATP-binding cassette domain-containing protein [Pelagibacterium xiamenense]